MLLITIMLIIHFLVHQKNLGIQSIVFNSQLAQLSAIITIIRTHLRPTDFARSLSVSHSINLLIVLGFELSFWSFI